MKQEVRFARKSNAFVLLWCAMAIAGCASAIAAVVVITWPSREPLPRLAGSGTSHDPINVAGCPAGSYPYWITDGNRCVFAGLSGVDPCVPGTMYTFGGALCRIGDITSVTADGPTSLTVDLRNDGYFDAALYLPFRTLDIVDSLAPDPSTQCRRTIRDGKSKIVGTYLGDCGSFNGDLTIMGFEPVAR